MLADIVLPLARSGWSQYQVRAAICRLSGGPPTPDGDPWALLDRLRVLAARPDVDPGRRAAELRAAIDAANLALYAPTDMALATVATIEDAEAQFEAARARSTAAGHAGRRDRAHELREVTTFRQDPTADPDAWRDGFLVYEPVPSSHRQLTEEQTDRHERALAQARAHRASRRRRGLA